MAKTSTNNSSSSSPIPTESLGVCEKLLSAIKASPAIQTIRRVSLRPTPPPVQNRHFTPKTIPILHGGSAHGNNKAVAIESTVDKKPEIRIDRGDDHDRLNQACSEFITRAGAKIRTTVSDHHLGDRGDGAANRSLVAMKIKKESFKDQLVSDYISRAKVKIRSPSSAKEMISLSFKTDQ